MNITCSMPCNQYPLCSCVEDANDIENIFDLTHVLQRAMSMGLGFCMNLNGKTGNIHMFFSDPNKRDVSVSFYGHMKNIQDENINLSEKINSLLFQIERL